MKYAQKSFALVATAALLLLGAASRPAAQDAGGSPVSTMEKGSISGRISGLDSSLIGIASVTAWSNDPSIMEWGKGRAVVDSLFSFRIDSLAPGGYYVVAEAPGYLPQYYNGVAYWSAATLVTVYPGQVTGGLTFELKPGTLVHGGTISGQVTGSDGLPLPFVNIIASTLFMPDPEKRDFIDIGYASSDENGRYTMVNLPPDDYYLRAEYWNTWFGQTLWYPQADSQADASTVTVSENSETSGIDFTFQMPSKAGRIAGRVVDALGNPLAAAGIQVMAAPDQNIRWNWIWLYADTDADGYYQIDQVPHGSYIAYCWAQNGWDYIQLWWPDATTMENAKIITISDETPGWQADFTLPLTPGTAALGGRVVNTEGRPLANAYIQITTAGNEYDSAAGRSFYAWASTDSSGLFKVDRLSPGSYIACATCWEGDSFGQGWYKDAGSLASATPIVLTEGENRTDIDFALHVHPIYGAIVGTVTDAATGQPLPRAYVQVDYRQDSADYAIRRFAWWPYYQITDDQGAFVFESLPEGSYKLSVYTNGAFAWYPDALVEEMAAPVDVVGGRKSEANFALTLRQSGTATISGQVRAEHGFVATEGDARPGNVRLEAVLDEYIPEIAVVMAKPAVTIMLWPDSEQFYTAVTDPDGSYTLKGLPDGEYYLSSFAPGHMLQYYKETFDPAEAVLVKVEAGQVITGIDFTLRANPWYFMKEGDAAGRNALNAIISGTVNDENGQGIAGAAVYLLDGSGQPVTWATADENGRFEIMGIANGPYYLQAGKLGYATTFNGNASSREATTPLIAANGLTEVNITLPPARSTGVDVRVLPDKVALLGNYPNPFNPETSIHFSLPSPMQVTLAIYDRLGRRVRQLHTGALPEGEHRLHWDGRSEQGETMTSGIYFYRLSTPAGIRTGKMVLMK